MNTVILWSITWIIKSYLKKFSYVVNELRIIDASFLDTEVLNPLFCATSLIGIHVTGPYQYLMINMNTSYGTFLPAFSTFYEELNNIKGAEMLNNER